MIKQTMLLINCFVIQGSYRGKYVNTRVYYDLKGLNLISLEVDAYYATTLYVLIKLTYARDIDHKRLYFYIKQ